jgi:hypothetical protein
MTKYIGNHFEFHFINVNENVIYASGKGYKSWRKKEDQYYMPSRFNLLMVINSDISCNIKKYTLDDESDKRFNRLWFEYVSKRSSRMPNFYADIRKCPYID